MSNFSLSNFLAESTAFINRYLFFLMCSIVVILYLLYTHSVLGLGTHQYFSLIDDGQIVHNYHIFLDCWQTGNCKPVTEVLVEKEFGRFRPGYWIVQTIIIGITQLHPTYYHVFRIVGIGSLLIILLIANIFTITKSFWGAVLASALFVVNLSFTENIVRLGTIEPYQLILLAIFSLLFLHFEKLQKKFSPLFINQTLLFLLLFSCLMKETVIALVPVLLLFWLLFRKNFSKLNWWGLFLPFTTIVIGKIISKPTITDTDYSAFYSASPSLILKVSQAYARIILSVFKWFIPFLALFTGLSLFKIIKQTYNQKALLYWVVLTACFSLILLPWQFVLERYLLIVIFGLAVIIGTVFELLLQMLKQWLKLFLPYPRVVSMMTTTIVVIAGANLFFISQPIQLALSYNYSHWYSNYLLYEHELVAAVADREETVTLNAVETLDNWEVLYEIPLHLHYLYGQKNKVTLPSLPLEAGQVVLTASSLVPDPDVVARLASGSAELARKEYQISQIEPALFRNQFRYRPLQTLKSIPINPHKIIHSWELKRVTSE